MPPWVLSCQAPETWSWTTLNCEIRGAQPKIRVAKPRRKASRFCVCVCVQGCLLCLSWLVSARCLRVVGQARRTTERLTTTTKRCLWLAVDCADNSTQRSAQHQGATTRMELQCAYDSRTCLAARVAGAPVASEKKAASCGTIPRIKLRCPNSWTVWPEACRSPEIPGPTHVATPKSVAASSS